MHPWVHPGPQIGVWAMIRPSLPESPRELLTGTLQAATGEDGPEAPFPEATTPLCRPITQTEKATSKRNMKRCLHTFISPPQ